MRYILSIKLHAYLQHQHPDILLTLRSEEAISEYLNKKLDSIELLVQELLDRPVPAYIIEELAMNALTMELGPSKFAYIKCVLQEEFIEYHQLLPSGALNFEIINLIAACDQIFEAIGFSEENEEDRNLRYAIIGAISEYFESGEKEKSRYGLQCLS